MSKKNDTDEFTLHEETPHTEEESHGLLLGPHLEPILKNPEPAHLPVLRQLGVALFLLVFVFLTSYAGTLVALMRSDEHDDDLLVSAKLVESTPPTVSEDPFLDIDIHGKAGFVWDVREQAVLFNKNADEPLPLASITKLMTALVAYELLGDEDVIDITIEAIRADGDSGLHDGETFSLKSLTDMVLIASSNDGAMALAEAGGKSIRGAVDPDALFVHAMNIRARELGLTETEFKNPTGLDVSPNEAGAVSSARDVAHLLEYIIVNYPEIVHMTTFESKRVYTREGDSIEVENTNRVVDEIDGLIASKTGYTDLAGGNLVIAFNAAFDRPIIVVSLGSSFEGRFNDIMMMSDAARTYITQSAH